LNLRNFTKLLTYKNQKGFHLKLLENHYIYLIERDSILLEQFFKNKNRSRASFFNKSFIYLTAGKLEIGISYVRTNYSQPKKLI
jgi:hypothetical protein